MRKLWLMVGMLHGLVSGAARAAPPVALEAEPVIHAGSANEQEVFVPAGGGAFELPVRADSICILTFPGEQVLSAVRSSERFEVNAWNDDSVAVRARPDASRATLAIATKSGAIKVNVSLRVVSEREPAFTLVRFRLVSAQRATEQRIAEEVERRVAELRAGLDAEARRLEQTIAERTEAAVVAAALIRAEVVSLRGHGRSDRHVVVHVERMLWLGEDAHVFFEIENRSSEPYRVAAVWVRHGDAVVSGEARLRSKALDQPAELLGVVRPESSMMGVVALRGSPRLRGKELVLEVADVAGHHKVRVMRGIVLQ